jgi:hypothetical protein
LAGEQGHFFQKRTHITKFSVANGFLLQKEVVSFLGRGSLPLFNTSLFSYQT